MSKLVEEILFNINKSNIISIGDSHAYFFKKLDKIEVEWVGPALAYNINNDISTNNTKSKISAILQKTDPSKTALILTFGEIDVRCHILKRVDIEGISVNQSVERVIFKYTEMIDILKNKGYEVFIHGLHGTGVGYNPQFPYYGTMEQRNKASLIFNSHLKNYCNLNKIPFTSLFDIVVDNTSYSTNIGYMEDDYHLNIDSNLQEIVLSRFLDKLKNFTQII